MATSQPPNPSPVPAAPHSLTLDQFERLLRCPAGGLDAYLGDISAAKKLHGTSTTVHCRYLRHDGTQRPRVKALAERMAVELIDYSIPRTRIEDARHRDQQEGSTRHIARLYKSAQQLFTSIGNTGEGGEMLLYLLAETYLKLPQLLCKMSLKTSGAMHYHGADAIHGTVDPSTGTLALYWGESKLYASISQALTECFKSLAPFLDSSGGTGTPHQRDLELLADNLDLRDPELEAAILRYLNPDDPSFNKVEYRGVCLVGFDVAAYPADGGTVAEEDIKRAIEKELDKWHGSITTHVGKHKIAHVTIEVFCLPWPSVEAFRRAFLSELGIA